MKKSPKQIRQSIRDARRAIAAPYAQQASYKFSERFAELEAYKAAQTVAGFLPFDGEANPLPLMDRAIQEGKSIFVPIIVGKGEPLRFAPWTRESQMRKNQFKIDEPVVDSQACLEPEEIDFVITPLVAFDERCNRLGVGGGFYDRSFEFLKAASSASPPRTTLVGIAFELQKVPQLTPQDHDVPLSGVVTELAVYTRQDP